MLTSLQVSRVRMLSVLRVSNPSLMYYRPIGKSYNMALGCHSTTNSREDKLYGRRASRSSGAQLLLRLFKRQLFCIQVKRVELHDLPMRPYLPKVGWVSITRLLASA